MGVSSSDSQHLKCSIKAADLRLYSIYFGMPIYKYGFDLRWVVEVNTVSVHLSQVSVRLLSVIFPNFILIGVISKNLVKYHKKYHPNCYILLK